MIKSCDAGSLPFKGNFKQFLEGAAQYGSSVDDSTKYFEKKVVEGVLDKIGAGIKIANYPQFRDMNNMFLEKIEGLKKLKGGYVETGVLSLKEGKERIPEVTAIRNCSKEIHEKTEENVRLKICVTGPYTLSTLFGFRDREIFIRIGNIISKIVEKNSFDEKNGRLNLVTLDEPAFGLMDDSLVDRGSEGRENLRKSWESIYRNSISNGIQTALHLHSTTDELFWDVKSLNIIESHVEDILYETKKTKDLLELNDKFMKASVCITDFDKLVRDSTITASKERISEWVVNKRVSEVWKEIHNLKLDPNVFLEDVNLIKNRLIKIVNRFGEERVLYAGPECGLRGFPTYECALECLRRVSKAMIS